MIWKRNTVSLRETVAAKAYLEDMAREGLFLENASVFRGLQFREDAPAEMDYLVLWAEGEMPEAEKTAYIDKGWYFVCRYLQVYVFRAPAGAESPEEKTEGYRKWAEKLQKNQKWNGMATLVYILFVGKKIYDTYYEMRECRLYSWLTDAYIVIIFLLGGLVYLYSDVCNRAAIREIEEERREILTVNWKRFQRRDTLNRMLPCFYLIALVVIILALIFF